MAKKDNTHPHLLEIKTLAKQLQSDAKQSGTNLVYGHALDQASTQYGYKDWNTACGQVGKANQYESAVLHRGLLLDMETNLPLNERERELYAMCGPLSAIEHSKAIEKALKDVRVRGEVIVGTQSLEDFGVSPKKIFYVKNNPLMSEHQNIIDNPNNEAVPEEYCGSIESIDAYVREKGGSLFFPTNSVADLRNLSDEQKKAIGSNIGTKILLGRTGQVASYDFSTNHNEPFVIGRPGAGKSVYFKEIVGALTREEREENPSLSEEEATRLVYEKYHIHVALNMDDGHKTSMEVIAIDDKLLYQMATEIRKHGDTKNVSKDRVFIKGLHDKHKKKEFRK